MQIQGLKYAPSGTFKVIRYVTYDDERLTISTYTMKRCGNTFKLFSSENKDISETVDHIEFKNDNQLLLWIKPSRLGLLHNIEKSSINQSCVK